MIKELDNIFKKTNVYDSKFVYIYSDFRFFFRYFKNNPQNSTKLFLELFTKKGITCVIPAFSYTTTGNFIVENTKSKVGFLANFVMKNFSFDRSEHPLFSFVSIGKNKKIVKNIGKSAFGNDSIHSRLYKKKTVFLNLFRPLKDGNTLVHHIEQKNKAKYRFDKKFVTRVIKNKKMFGTNFKAYVRKYINKKEDLFTFKKIYKDLIKKDFVFQNKVKSSNIFIYDYDALYAYFEKRYKKDKFVFVNK